MRRIEYMERLEARHMLSGIPELVSDLVTSQAASEPDQFTRAGAVTFFAADNGSDGRELWKTDGTENGTVMVKDIFHGPSGSRPQNLTPFRDKLVFLANDGVSGQELWVSDGTTEGTQQLVEVTPGPEGGRGEFLKVGEHLLFRTYRENRATDLWVAEDATPDKTLFLRAIQPGAEEQMSTIQDLTSNVRFFSVDNEVWRTDGTFDGTLLVHRFNRQNEWAQEFIPIGDRVFFHAAIPNGVSRLWVTDGSAAGTRQIEGVLENQGFVEFNGTLLFVASQGPGDSRTIWRSDGTTEGTYSLGEMANALLSTHAVIEQDGNQILLFSADNESGSQLWRTDGTRPGTYNITDLAIETGPRGIRNIHRHQDFAIFWLDDSLWRSDGTEAGTQRYSDPDTAIPSPTYYNATGGPPVLGNSLYFTNPGSFFEQGGNELWKTDGTTAGTMLVKEFPLESNNGLKYLTNLDGQLLFAADDGEGQELWRSDGTLEGTQIVKDIRPGTAGSQPDNLRSVGDDLFFLASFEPYRRELVHSNARSGLTELVERAPDSGNGTPSIVALESINHHVVFSETDSPHQGDLYSVDRETLTTTDLGRTQQIVTEFVEFQEELLFTDASVAGTWQLEAIDGERRRVVKTEGLLRPPTHDQSFTVLGDQLFFVADVRRQGLELAVYHSNTVNVVRDIVPGRGSSSPDNLIVSGEHLFFTATDELGEIRLWKSDGTEEGTQPVSSNLFISEDEDSAAMHSFNGELYFSAHPGDGNAELWKTDGTEAGTELVKDIWPGLDGSFPTEFFSFGNRLFLTAEDQHAGREIWSTDGTEAGTSRLIDLRAGAGSANPREFVEFMGELYFSADDGISGIELWKTAGTEDSTRQVADIWPGDNNAAPADLTVANDTLYFVADDGIHGRELWKLANSPTPGDSNHDGVFNSSDLVFVFQIGEYEDQEENNSTFQEGDWNGDGEFDSSDFVFAFQAGSYQQDLRLRAIHDSIFTDAEFESGSNHLSDSDYDFWDDRLLE